MGSCVGVVQVEVRGEQVEQSSRVHSMSLNIGPIVVPGVH